MSEPLTKKSRSLSAAIINAAYDGKLTAKLTITQEEGYVAYYKTNIEEELSETSKASANLYTKYMPQKRKATMMTSSKTWNYHIRDIIYNLYKGNIF